MANADTAGPGPDARTWSATGPVDAPAIVFVHGTRVSRAQWDGAVRRLSDAFRCVTLDLPGHGTRVADGFTLDGAADDVAAVIAAAVPSGRAVVVGASLGGYVGLETAVRHPERVSGLVLVACSADPAGPTAWPFRLYAMALERLPWRILDAAATRFFRTIYGRRIGGAIVAGGFGREGAPQAVRSLIGERFRDRLFGVWAPVLVVNGAFDLLFAPGGDAWAATCRRGRHRVVRSAGHLVDLDRPATFARLVRSFAREADAIGSEANSSPA